MSRRVIKKKEKRKDKLKALKTKLEQLTDLKLKLSAAISAEKESVPLEVFPKSFISLEDDIPESYDGIEEVFYQLGGSSENI